MIAWNDNDKRVRMRPGHLSVAIGGMLLLVGCSDGSKPEGEEAPSSISGVVRDFDTGEPIASALVTLQATSTQTTTASDGSFELILASGSNLR